MHPRNHCLFPRQSCALGVVWWLVMLWGACCHHARAQFAANPLSLDTTHALVLNGVSTGDRCGISVTGVGDVSGDGVDDFVVGAYFADPFNVSEAGQAYLLFGRSAGNPWAPNPFDVSSLDGTNGVTLHGVDSSYRLGWTVAGVRDVNGDSINDFIIGTVKGNVAYVVFGTDGAWPAAVNLTQGAFNGFVVEGQWYDRLGHSVSGVGDVNHDGLPDFAIGATIADTDRGRMYVLYGRPDVVPWPSVVTLATHLNASTGFSVRGDDSGDNCGEAVSGVGDVNGDGVDDVAVGCKGANAHSVSASGVVLVVFGSSSGLPVNITQSQLDGSNGFVVNGQRTGDHIGTSVSEAGDVNADGVDDFIIGAPEADANGLTNSGETYVLFGRNASVLPWPPHVDVSSLDGNNGFTLAGSDAGDFLGQSVGPARDVNTDGTDDFLVGASGARSLRGAAFVVYGRRVWPAVQLTTDLDVSAAATFEGVATGDACGRSVSRVGDVNGDGRPDMGIGCFGADPGGRGEAGQTAIVFGPLFTPSPTATPTTAAPSAAPTAAPTMAPSTAAPSTASPTNSPNTASPTASPTSNTDACSTQSVFVPPGATCVNGVLVTSTNTSVPSDAPVTISTSVTVVGGASFEQPSGSTLVFVAGSTEQSTFISVVGGGCATIAGDAVVSFEADPSNGGQVTNTGSLELVTADCVVGEFGSVSATTSFEGDECVAVGEGEQQASGSSLSVTFALSNACQNKSIGLSPTALTGIIVGVVVALILGVIGAAALQHRKQIQKREATLDAVKLHQQHR